MKLRYIRASVMTGMVGTIFMLGMSAAQASAASAIPDVRPGTYVFALTNEPSECIVTNGVGNQLSISNTATCARITVSAAGTDYTFQNGNGHCLKVNSQYGTVFVATGSCVFDDVSELWSQTNGSPNYRFESDLTATWLKTNAVNPSPGAKVFVGINGDNNRDLIRQ